MTAPLPVREYANLHDMKAAYLAIHRRTYAPRVVAPKPVVVFHDQVTVIPEPIPPPNLDLTRIAYRQAQDAMAEGRRAHLAERKPLTDCLRIACAVTGFSADEIRGERRLAHFVKARQIAMFLMVRIGKRSMPEAGRFLGGRDHTTVLHGARRVDAVLRNHRITDLSDPVDVAQRLWEADWGSASGRAAR